MKLDVTPIRKQVFTEIPTIKDFSGFFVETYAEAHNKPSELIAKRQILNGYVVPMLGEFKLNEISNEHIDIFVSRMRTAGASPKTINNRLAVLHKLLKYAHLRKFIDKVPTWEPLKVTIKQMRFLSIDEVEAISEAAKAQGPYWYAMVITGLHTGMRNGEIRALQWRDVDFKREIIRVSQADYRGHMSTPKSAAGNRLISMNSTLIEALNGVLRLGPLVFGKPPDGSIIAHETTRNRLRIICREAGVKACGWHTLRHTFASHMAMAGVPLGTIRELMGHSDIKMTMRYSHLSPEAKSNATGILVNLFNSTSNNQK